MTRSTRLVYKSHQEHLFKPLDLSGIQYDVFLHTWQTQKNLIWDKDAGQCDYEEYKFLKPSAYRIDSQEDFLKGIDMSDYFYQDIWSTKGDSKQGEWWPSLIRNHLCALESMKRVTKIVLDSGNPYEYIIFVRPDVEICSPFSYPSLRDNEIAIVPYDSHEGYNDKFAMMRLESCKPYAFRIDEAAAFRVANGRIVSEKFTGYIINRNYRPRFIDFRFEICRPDGTRLKIST
jgi:hypothetical protein